MTDEIKSEPVTEAPKIGKKKTDVKTDVKNVLTQLESTLDEYLVKKAPFTIPEDGKELIVKISPYISLIFAVMGLPLIFGAIGLTAILAPFAFLGAHYSVVAFLSAIFAAISLVLELIAVPGLFKRSKKGWSVAFYATIVSLLGNIVSFDIVGGVVGAIIGWYILFQVKEKYVN